MDAEKIPEQETGATTATHTDAPVAPVEQVYQIPQKIPLMSPAPRDVRGRGDRVRRRFTDFNEGVPYQGRSHQGTSLRSRQPEGEDEQRSDNQTSARCWECGGEHLRRNCPNVTCYGCNKRGHVLRNCHIVSRRKSRRPAVAQYSINTVPPASTAVAVGTPMVSSHLDTQPPVVVGIQQPRCALHPQCVLHPRRILHSQCTPYPQCQCLHHSSLQQQPQCQCYPGISFMGSDEG